MSAPNSSIVPYSSSPAGAPPSSTGGVGVFETLWYATVAADRQDARNTFRTIDASYSSRDVNARLVYYKSHARAKWHESFRGNRANLWRYVPVQALGFTFNEKFRSLLTPTDSDALANSLSRNFAAGSLAAVSTTLIVHPIDNARSIATQEIIIGVRRNQKYKGLIDCMTKTVKERGWIHSGLYQTFSVRCAEQMIYRGLYFGIYNTYARSPETGFLLKLVIANLSAALAWYAAYPFTTIRRQIQITSSESGINMSTAARKVHSNGGWSGFFRGVSIGGAPQFMFRSVSNTVTLVAFDYLVKRAEELSKVSTK